MPEWIAKYWIQWAFGIITGALGLAYKRLSAKVKKHEEERQAKAKAQEAEMAAIKEGLLAILHDRLYQACTYYIALGYIDTAGLKNRVHLQGIPRPGRQWYRHRAVQPRQGAAPEGGLTHE